MGFLCDEHSKLSVADVISVVFVSVHDAYVSNNKKKSIKIGSMEIFLESNETT